jgi:hypothetical protein
MKIFFLKLSLYVGGSFLLFQFLQPQPRYVQTSAPPNVVTNSAPTQTADWFGQIKTVFSDIAYDLTGLPVVGDTIYTLIKSFPADDVWLVGLGAIVVISGWLRKFFG